MESFVIVLVALAIAVLFAGVKSVSQGWEYTIERFGRYQRTLEPGLNFIIPFIDRIGKKMNMMENVLDVPSQQIISRDNAMVTVDGIVFFRCWMRPRRRKVTHLQAAILNLVMTNIRTVMGSMDLDALLSQRYHQRQAVIGDR